MRYYARLNPAKVDEAFLNRDEVVKLSDAGSQLGFGLSVLDERGLLREAQGLDPERVTPLLTWPFLDYLESLELGAQSLLELGAGASTLWFQQRFARVRSFETDPTWYRALTPMLGPNVELSLTELGKLEASDIEYRGEQLVLVDFAGHRTRFLKAFLARVGAERPPAIALDNADWYRNGARLLSEHVYREIPFHGFKSGQPFVSCTSLFIDPQRFVPTVKDPFFCPAFARRRDNAWDLP